MCERCMVASCAPLIGDLVCNQGMCPDWELNQWLFVFQARAQSTEPHQPGQWCLHFLCCTLHLCDYFEEYSVVVTATFSGGGYPFPAAHFMCLFRKMIFPSTLSHGFSSYVVSPFIFSLKEISRMVGGISGFPYVQWLAKCIVQLQSDSKQPFTAPSPFAVALHLTAE